MGQNIALQSALLNSRLLACIVSGGATAAPGWRKNFEITQLAVSVVVAAAAAVDPLRRSGHERASVRARPTGGRKPAVC